MRRRQGLIARLKGLGKVLARAPRREVPAFARLLAKQPPLLGAMSLFELALLATNRVDARLKYLAVLKASSLVGCPF